MATAAAAARPGVERLEPRALLSVDALDPAFGAGGLARAVFRDTPTLDVATAVARLPDGRYLVAGETRPADSLDGQAASGFALARYLPDGSLDPAFGDGGLVVTPGLRAARALAVQGDGKVLAAGDGFAVARFLPGGALDGSFGGGDGIVVPPASAEPLAAARAFALAVAADGTVVVAGETYAAPRSDDPTDPADSGDYSGRTDFVLARYLPDGRFDRSLAGTGYVITNASGGGARENDGARALALLPGGKILAGGYGIFAAATHLHADFVVLRYNADGSLDNSFGSGGQVHTDFPPAGQAVGGYDLLAALALADDGSFVAAGVARGGTDGAAARYSPDGTLDPTFGDGGGRVYRPGRPFRGAAIVPASGQVLLGGTDAAAGDFVVERLSPVGRPDPAFGVGGTATADFGGSADSLRALSLAPDGRVLAVGAAAAASPPGGLDFALARFTAGGQPDPAFGAGGGVGNGRVLTDFSAGPVYAVARDVIAQPDGKLLAVGLTHGTRHFPLARFNPDGSLDPSFGDGGLTRLNPDPGRRFTDARAVALAPGGAIVVVGQHLGDFAIARYTADGRPDLAFGAGGVVFTDIPFGDSQSIVADRATAVAVQPDGKLVVGGADGKEWALARYLPDGRLDPTFGAGGLADTGILSDSFGEGVRDLALQPDGKIVAVGEFSTPAFPEPLQAVRFLPDGSLDGGFGDGGKVQAFAPPELDRAYLTNTTAVLLRPDGRIVIGGYQRSAFFTLYGLNPDGSPDATFGTNGRAFTDFGSEAFLQDLALRADGLVVASGFVYAPDLQRQTQIVAAYRPDGSPERAFGTDGRVRTGVKLPYAPRVALVARPDGQVIISGVAGVIGDDGRRQDMALAALRTTPMIGLAADPAVVNELNLSGQGALPINSFRFRRSGDLSAPLTLAVTVGGTAAAGADYRPLPAAVTFAAGSPTATLGVKTVDDYLAEGDESVTLSLGPLPAGYTLASPSSATVTIRDNEGPDRFEANDTFAAAAALGQVRSRREVKLSLHHPADQDYFRFTPYFDGRVGVGLLFEQALGDLDLEVYDGANGALLGASTGGGDAENVAVAVRAGGAYVVRVFGRGGTANPGYDLKVEARGPRSDAPTLRDAAPTRIEAEYFDRGGEGLAYHDTTPRNTGADTGADIGGEASPGDGVDATFTGFDLAGTHYRVTDTKPGEWLEYTVDVPAAPGSYLAEFVVSNTDPGGRFHLEADGVDVTGEVAVPDTDGLGNPSTVSRLVDLPAGRHVLRLAVDAASANGSAGDFDFFRFTAMRQTVAVTSNGMAVSESGDSGIPRGGAFVVSRTGSTRSALAVDYTLGGTAAHGVDYEALPGTLVFPAGVASVTVPLRALDDALVEGDELAELVLSDSAGGAYAVGAGRSAAVRIADNEPPNGGGPTDNDGSFGDATRLDVVSRYDRDFLSIQPAGDEDFVHFYAASEAMSVRIAFEHDLGDLTLVLYDHYGTEIRRSAGAGDAERVTLPAGLPNGPGHYTRVLGAGPSVTNPRYALHIEPFDPARPDVRVQAGPVDVADGQAAAVEFGTVRQGQPPPRVTFTVANDGGGGQPLTLGAVSVPAGFTLVEGLPASLAAGASDTFTVQMDATAQGARSGEVRFATGDADENPFNFPVTGRVTDPAAPTADVLDVSPDPRTTAVGQVSIVFSEPVVGFDQSDLTLTRDGGTGSANLLTAAQTLATADGGRTWTLGNLSALTRDAGEYRLALGAGGGSGITDVSGNPLAGGADDAWRTDAAVAGRHVFYNRSAFDGHDPNASAADDAAVAPDKVALLPGQTATFANYTSYSRGLNGIVIDLHNLPPGVPSPSDFVFRAGNNNAPGTWSAAPAPGEIAVRRGAGAGGSDRVTLTWRDATAVKGRWLQVTVKATAATGLPAADVFYFGNAPGESGNWATAALVNSVDEAAARHRPRGARNPAPVDFRWDYNRDRLVNSADVLVARRHRTTAATALQLITPGAGANVVVAGTYRPSGPTRFEPSATMQRVGAGDAVDQDELLR